MAQISDASRVQFNPSISLFKGVLNGLIEKGGQLGLD